MNTCSIDNQLIINNAIDIINLSLNGSDELIEKIFETIETKCSLKYKNQQGGDCASLRKRLFASGILSILLSCIACGSITSINKTFGSSIGITNFHLYLIEGVNWVFTTKLYKAYNNSAKFSDPISYYKSYITTPLHIIKSIKPFYTTFLKPQFIDITNRICDIFGEKYKKGLISDVLDDLIPLLETIQ